MEKLDVIVIGSGPNGLSAAIRCAQAGLSVRVYEASATSGGGMRSAELTLPGFLHDICSTSHPLGAASPFFQSLPLKRHGLEWVHPDIPFAHPLDDGRAVEFRRSLPVTAAELVGRDADAYESLMRPLVDRWDWIARDLLGPAGIPRHPFVAARFGLRALRSAEYLCNKYFQTEDAQALLAGCAAHAAVPLDERGSAAPALVLMAAGHVAGWPFPRGGAQRIADALAGYLRELGGEIVTSHPVTSLGELPDARAVLFDTSPKTLLDIAGDALPEPYRVQLDRFQYGPGVFKIDWALSEPIPWAADACRRAGVLHLGGTLREVVASEAAVWRGEHPERPFVLLAQTSLFDPTRAPDGLHTGWAYCHVPNGSSRDMTGAIERQVERFAPGFRDTILARATMNSVEMDTYNPNYVGGDINGGAATLRQLLARPVASVNPYATPNGRLWLCSASTPPGGGVHGLCGMHCADRVVRRLGV